MESRRHNFTPAERAAIAAHVAPIVARSLHGPRKPIVRWQLERRAAVLRREAFNCTLVARRHRDPVVARRAALSALARLYVARQLLSHARRLPPGAYTRTDSPSHTLYHARYGRPHRDRNATLELLAPQG